MTRHAKSTGDGPFTGDLESDPGIGRPPGPLRTGEASDLLEADDESRCASSSAPSQPGSGRRRG